MWLYQEYFFFNELKNILRPKIFLARNKILGTDQTFKLHCRNLSQFSHSILSSQFLLGIWSLLAPINAVYFKRFYLVCFFHLDIKQTFWDRFLLEIGGESLSLGQDIREYLGTFLTYIFTMGPSSGLPRCTFPPSAAITWRLLKIVTFHNPFPTHISQLKWWQPRCCSSPLGVGTKYSKIRRGLHRVKKGGNCVRWRAVINLGSKTQAHEPSWLQCCATSLQPARASRAVLQ